jgi:hypothetical protein
MDRWLARLRGLGVLARGGVSALVVLAVYALVAPVAWRLSGPMGLAAAGVAAACCWFGALSGSLVALVVGRLVQEQARVSYEFLSGMLLRMGIPLVVALGFHFSHGLLASAGLLYYLLVFYPVTLAMETALSLPPADQ